MKTISFIFLVSTLFFSCKPKAKNRLTQSIFIFKDKDGVYEYNPLKNKEQLIFKATNEQLFLNELCEFNNDTILIPIKEKYSNGLSYTMNYYSVANNNLKNWLSKQIIYSTKNRDDTLVNIKTFYFNENKKILAITDSIKPFKGFGYEAKESIFGDNWNSAFSISTVKQKSVSSYEGSLFLIERNDTTALLKYYGHFSRKIQSGYLEPKLAPSQDYATFLDASELDFFDTTKKITLNKINLESKMVTKIKEGIFSDIQFSKDGKFILYKRNEKDHENNTWSSDIYYMDLESLEEIKISNGFNAIWRP